MAKITKIDELYSKICENWDNVPYIDFQEMIARQAVSDTCSDVEFKVNEKYKSESGFNWEAFVDNIKFNNDIALRVKGNIKLLSKFGKIINYWDIIKGQIVIGTADENHCGLNNLVRINQYKPVGAIFVYSPIKTRGLSPTYSIKEYRTNNETQRVLMSGPTFSKDWMMVDIFKSGVPEILKWYMELYPNPDAPLKTNYGILSAKEFYNLDIIDYEVNEFQLADIYPSAWLCNLVNGKKGFLNFLKDEPNLDFTTRIGKFNYSDTQQGLSDFIAMNKQNAMRTNSQTQITSYVNSVNTFLNSINSNDPLRSKMVIETIGSDNNITTMQTTFDGARHIEYLNRLTQYIFKSSGYTWNVEDAAAMRTNSGVEHINKLSYETTKNKVRINNKNWREFIADIAYAFAMLEKKDEVYANKVREESFKAIKFNIVSNLLNDYVSKNGDIIERLDSGLISQEEAIRLTNQEMSEEERQEMFNQIKEKQEQEREDMMEMSKNEFDNQDIEKPKKKVVKDGK